MSDNNEYYDVPHTTMTEVERVVYGVTFAHIIMRDNPPAHVLGPAAPKNAWRDWEIEQAVSAAEHAWGAVVRLRLCGPAVLDGFADDPVYEAWKDATGK